MKPIVALAPEELRALLTVARERDQRTYLLFLVTVLHGLRVSEVIQLRVRDFNINSDAMTLTVKRLKSSNETTQRLLSSTEPLLDEARLMAEWLRNRQANEYVFTNSNGKPLTRWGVNYLIEHYARRAGIAEHKRFPHALKHTCGVHMRKSGANLEQIQNALGHKRLDSTAMYLRVTQDEVDDARAKAFAH
jgi:site-specific recombinase XerD